MSSAIEASGLAKSYGDHAAVAGVSLAVAPGEIFAYLGRNGSGKTTTVRMLTTLTSPSAGSARVAGFDVASNPAEVRAHIGVTMQEAALDPQMSGVEHLEFIAGMLGHDRASARQRSSEVLDLFGLSDAATKRIGTYSGGMQRRLDIATALLGEPAILFLDEPTTGLDPQSRRALWDEIVRLKNRGTTVFLTTQYLEEADHLADHVAIIDRGSIIAHGTASSLKAQHGRKRISFASPPNGSSASPSLTARLEAVGGVEVTASNGRVSVDVDASFPDSDLLTLISSELATGAGGGVGVGELRDLEIRTATLEDVFLRLTGSSINQTDPTATADPASTSTPAAVGS